MRGKDPVPSFVAAFAEDQDIALRIMQWARDVRGGAGERELFRQVLSYLENVNSTLARQLMDKIPEIGRWDDLLVVKNPILKQHAFGLIQKGLAAGNGLCAKWMPRKGKIAEELRAFLDYSPKRYRKTLVTLTNVVETQMCANQWDSIEFGKIPSLASARYKKAFVRHASEQYAAYAEALKTGEAKINAGAVFPYDVLKGGFFYKPGASMSETERNVALAQWDALPNYVGNASVLPMIDVSESMNSYPIKNTSVTPMDVAVSLGLYLAEKNTGKFKDVFMTFTDQPELYNLKGNVFEKMEQMVGRKGYSTNIDRAFEALLKFAIDNKLPQIDMPESILILSDMQFDNSAIRGTSVTAFAKFRALYKDAGYEMPNVVFWNLHSHGGAPTRFDENGVALISGFSPSIVQTVLACEDLTPMAIMMAAVMSDRYALV
jgi:hypothetical protein